MIIPRYDCITYMDNGKISEEHLITVEEFRDSVAKTTFLHIPEVFYLLYDTWNDKNNSEKAILCTDTRMKNKKPSNITEATEKALEEEPILKSATLSNLIEDGATIVVSKLNSQKRREAKKLNLTPISTG